MKRLGSMSADPRAGFASERTADLSDARAAVLGTGSVGSFVAWCLASRGVGHLILADKDRMASENLRRHVCGRPDLDRHKPDALGEFLADRFESVSLEPRSFCFRERPDVLGRLLKDVEIAVVAVDDEGAKYLIDAILWELSRPAVFLGVYGGGWGGEAILVDPERGTPCYGCAAAALGRAGIQVERDDAGSAYALPSSSEQSSEWPRADLTSVMPLAALGADLASAWLETSRGEDRRRQELCSPDESAWRLGLRRVDPWSLGPWELAAVPVSRSEECAICGLRTGLDSIRSAFTRLVTERRT
jgi:molybdopterin/thiamine biosynthesis adenylyltransferase